MYPNGEADGKIVNILLPALNKRGRSYVDGRRRRNSSLSGMHCIKRTIELTSKKIQKKQPVP